MLLDYIEELEAKISFDPNDGAIEAERLIPASEIVANLKRMIELDSSVA